MDPLSIAASIAGLLSAAGAVTKALAPYVAAARETPKVAVQVHSEMQSIAVILSALQVLTRNLGSIPMQRAALVQVDHVVAVLTDGVLIFSDLEDVVKSLDSLGDLSLSITRLSLRSRLQWAWKESDITSLLARLQGFKLSASLILNILQSDSAMRAEGSRTDLTNNVNHLLESSKDVARRLMNLEDNFDARSMVSKRRSVAVSVKLGHAEDDETTRFLNRVNSIQDENTSQLATSPSTLPRSEYTRATDVPFEQHLEESLAYRRAQRESMDFSFRSSVAWSNGISTFSGLTLGDISVMSVIALPICAAEISNAHHYTFGNLEPPAPLISPTNREQHAAVTTVNSLLYECLEITLQLSRICFSDIFWKEGLYSNQEHPFGVLRRIFSQDNPYLMLVQPSDHNAEPWELLSPTRELLSPTKDGDLLSASAVEDAAEFDALLRSGDVGLLRALDVIKAMLAVKFAAETPIEPFRILGLIRKKRGYFKSGETPPPSDVVVEDFLAQERLFFHQLEDLPTVEKQMKLLNLLVKERLSAIFVPLYDFMQIQLRFLLDIEQNLLLPPQSQRWNRAFRDWSLNTELIGKLIANETRTKWILRARLGDNEDPGQNYSPQVDTIAACFRLVSLPALVMLGYEEFLENLEQQIDDADTTRKSDISESRKIILRAHEEISRIAKQEDLSGELSHLRRDMTDWKRLAINKFGELLMYDASVRVLDIRMPQRPHSTCRMYTFEKVLIFADKTADRRQSLRARGLLGTQKSLQLKDRILLSNIKAIVRSEPITGPFYFNSSDCSCLVVYTVGSEQEALEIRFTTPSQMQGWTEELRAAIQTPQQKEEHTTYEATNVSTVPVTYPKAWKTTLLDRGFLT
ncbi:hypothetical protein QBC37DRAFT_391391 [Rhypophila decipiens]|uniref:PH domain-containing protein n=1 Tax=Rhypophila decipiens TaxID=261697 RepID=A0AAN6Y362_9PEZI|nr:hypothetical protein QBC37DRAFT_391391 [Rhypophila decipiens]